MRAICPPGPNSAVMGNPKLAGSFHTPNTRNSSTSAPM
jgi:hypothetical protein